jgi:hypothetical protein
MAYDDTYDGKRPFPLKHTLFRSFVLAHSQHTPLSRPLHHLSHALYSISLTSLTALLAHSYTHLLRRTRVSDHIVAICIHPDYCCYGELLPLVLLPVVFSLLLLLLLLL